MVQFDLTLLMDDARCYDALREMRWSEGQVCPHCESKSVIRRGFDERHTAHQRYECKICSKRFDDLTGTMFAGYHQPLKVWILALHLMGLNVSNTQIAQELGLNKDDVQHMTTLLRNGILEKKPPFLKGEAEFDKAFKPNSETLFVFCTIPSHLILSSSSLPLSSQGYTKRLQQNPHQTAQPMDEL